MEFSSILVLLANLYDINHCCVYSKKTTDDGQRNCPKHVEFHSKNKFEKLVHLVGFILRNLSRCTVTRTSYFSYFVTNTVYGSRVFYKKLIVVYLLKKLQFLETEISLQCSQKPAAEFVPQTVESSPHFDSRLPKNDFQSICFQFSPSVSCLQGSCTRQNGNDILEESCVGRWGMS